MPGTGTGATECTVNADAALRRARRGSGPGLTTGKMPIRAGSTDMTALNDFLVSIEKELAGEELGSMLAAIGRLLSLKTQNTGSFS